MRALAGASGPGPSAVAALHDAFDFAFAFAVLDDVALVVFGLALGQGDLAFHAAIGPNAD